MIMVSLCVFEGVLDQFPNQVWLFLTPWTAALQASLCLIISWSLPKFVRIASVMPSKHLILCHPLLLLPLIFTSIRSFSNESALCIRHPKYWSFSINPYNECSGLISFRIDWFDLLAIQGTLSKSSPALQIPIRGGLNFPPNVLKQDWMATGVLFYLYAFSLKGN